ncbi:2'-5'-oligoadenylate synthase 1-like [Pomacea canaliculata]|uniref:2'-5'-oligoadenylate synthase 1-like n=1 Tax=Pomacea canaliculata TaxID=400727 RepID=UPI000D73C707|nr:2'-5'-oligoadenylate synthase 1-like [Pomacea canaliculata]XP_025086257.1 2'-5'-oligoadenylate synthase 1-like [Pomacea canaliculata]XP_025086258.1 2'-5'-oligoadenylate synthase 1-like [Pomacea canaliculata]
MGPAFRLQAPGESLDSFAQRQITTTPLERTRFGQDVDTFVQILHFKAFCGSYTVKEVVKSGSLGKGTAVRDLADIDLVVFINGLTSIADLQANRGRLLNDLEQKVKNVLGISPVKRTQYSLSFNWNGHKVDILPAFDLLSRYGGSPADIYNAMVQFGPNAALEFSASLAPLQVQFVKPVPEHVKRVIRLLKLWAEENGLNIRSYTLELLTIFLWRSRGGGNPGTDFLFYEAIKQLVCCGSLRIAFGDNYNSSFYTRLMTPPYVLDPANPYMNTLSGADTVRISIQAMVTFMRLYI